MAEEIKPIQPSPIIHSPSEKEQSDQQKKSRHDEEKKETHDDGKSPPKHPQGLFDDYV